jgi:hypothetical protein
MTYELLNIYHNSTSDIKIDLYIIYYGFNYGRNKEDEL